MEINLNFDSNSNLNSPKKKIHLKKFILREK